MDVGTDSRIAQGEQLRVFISYSHADRPRAEALRDHLVDIGQIVFWDRGFVLGARFPDQIRTQIAYSHIFMPLISDNSDGRSWVQQEIGYATALNIPILPISVGQHPPGMLQHLHALYFPTQEIFMQLIHEVEARHLHQAIAMSTDGRPATYECAFEVEDRSKLLRSYCQEIRRLGYDDRVRQSGSLSSFHIPCESPGHARWHSRYAGITQPSLHHKILLRSERLELGHHARRKGAKLLIWPNQVMRTVENSIPAAISRIETLVAYLRDSAHEDTEVFLDQPRDGGESITIVGDWFMAISRNHASYPHYQQTIFTRHTPSIRERIALFDAECAEAEERTAHHWRKGETSRDRAIAGLTRMSRHLQKHRSLPARP